MADAPSLWGTANATLTDPAPPGGEYTPSGWGTANATLSDPSAPSAPQSLTFTRVGNTITLTWNAPESDGGSPIIGWTVDRGAGMAGTQDDIPLIGTGPFSYEYTETASGWIGNPGYSVSVRANTETAHGAWAVNVHPYADPVEYVASEWGTADATLVDPTPSGGWAPSPWGTANATLTNPGPPGGYSPSAWGTANATLHDPVALNGLSTVAYVDGAWVEVEAVRWNDTAWITE